MDPWYKVATPRKEVREGRSFNPDEFAIALEQVVAGTAPEDYRDPEKFFSRTCFTRALKEHAGMVLQRLTARPKALRRSRRSSLNLAVARPIHSPVFIISRKAERKRARIPV
jgi:predicted AAA+ superfamily ATPase